MLEGEERAMEQERELSPHEPPLGHDVLAEAMGYAADEGIPVHDPVREGAPPASAGPGRRADGAALVAQQQLLPAASVARLV